MAETTRREHGPLDVIQAAMGVMGPWQIIIAISLSLVNFPVAWQQLSITFLAPKPNYTCIEPAPFNNKFDWGNPCTVTTGFNGTIPVVKKCTGFRYDNEDMDSTIITEWNLVCEDKYKVSVVQSVLMFGILVGNTIFGVMADRIGRKIPLMIAVVVQSVTSVLSTFATTFVLFLVCKFIAAIATGGTMLISFVLLMEVVGVEWRSTLSVLFHIPFLLGHLSIPFIAYLTKHWTSFLRATSLPALALLSYYWLVPESPRWLLAVGKINKARRVLNAAARRNSIAEDKVIAAIESHSNQSGKETESDLDSSKTYSILDLFRTPNMRIRTICIAVNWLVCGICFFGLSQFVGSLKGKLVHNVAISAACELPGICIVLYFISRVSRLKLLISSNVAAGVSLIVLAFVPNNWEVTQLILLTMGLSAMSMSFPTIYLYTGELFPTVMRNIGFGVCSVSSRIGSIIAPWVINENEMQIPALIFGIGPLIGAGLCLLLPETMNCRLPETIEEAENFKKNNRLRRDIALEPAN